MPAASVLPPAPPPMTPPGIPGKLIAQVMGQISAWHGVENDAVGFSGEQGL